MAGKKLSVKPRRAFMCGTAWVHDLRRKPGSVELFRNIHEFEESHACSEECGLVEVEVRLVRWVKSRPRVRLPVP